MNDKTRTSAARRTRTRSTKPIAGFALTFAVALFTTTPSIAGYIGNPNVIIDAKNAEARGLMMANAKLDPKIGLIHCRVTRRDTNGLPLNMRCNATTASGEELSCRSADSHMIRVATSLKSAGYLLFRRSENGQCSFMQTRKGSPFPSAKVRR